MKRITLLFLFGQFTVLILSFFSKGGITLLSYINNSFYVGGVILLLGGIIYIIRTGSFDFFTSSMRKVIATKNSKDDLDTMRAPSEVFSASPKIFFWTGLPIIILMFVAMVFYNG